MARTQAHHDVAAPAGRRAASRQQETQASPRLATRSEAPDRIPDSDGPERLPARDPNKIYNRDGVEVTLRYSGDEDKFSLEAVGVIPPTGWTYEWKAKTIKNWEWHDHQVELYQNGWTPVPAERHDGLLMPKGHKGAVERGGLILMERDERLTARARAMDERRAAEPVRNSRTMAGLRANMGNINPDAIDYTHDAAAGASFTRVDRLPRVNDAKYKYTIDE